MKLCTYQTPQGPRLGTVVDGTVHELTATVDEPALEEGAHGPSSDPMKVLLEADGAWARVADALRAGDANLGSSVGSIDDLELLPPVRRPDKFICIGLNYRTHAEEAGMDIPEVPTFFVKLPNALRGHRQVVPLPRVSHRIDWEGEVAFVIGRRAYHVDEDHALDHVAGYTIVNDVSARDYQFKTSQWNLGKTFDGFAPMGPVIATADEVSNTEDIPLTTTVSGELKQKGSTADLIFGVAQLVAFLSTVMTLEPGDIVATGTPSGIGAMERPRRWLTEQDTVTISVPGIGVLENTFAPAR